MTLSKRMADEVERARAAFDRRDADGFIPMNMVREVMVRLIVKIRNNLRYLMMAPEGRDVAKLNWWYQKLGVVLRFFYDRH